MKENISTVFTYSTSLLSYLDVFIIKTLFLHSPSRLIFSFPPHYPFYGWKGGWSVEWTRIWQMSLKSNIFVLFISNIRTPPTFLKKETITSLWYKRIVISENLAETNLKIFRFSPFPFLSFLPSRPFLFFVYTTTLLLIINICHTLSIVNIINQSDYVILILKQY